MTLERYPLTLADVFQFRNLERPKRMKTESIDKLVNERESNRHICELSRIDVERAYCEIDLILQTGSEKRGCDHRQS